MAEKRMLTKKVTDDDNFLSLSSSAQALYLHLSMSADDDGFCNQVSVSMFKAHASVQDLQALLEKRYLYQFENGVIVIKHWRMANALRKDRYTPTAFQEELKQLKIKENGAYTLSGDGSDPYGCQVVANRLPDGCHSIDKDRLDKNRIGENNARTREEPLDLQWCMDLWNDLKTYGIKPVIDITGTRYQALKDVLQLYGEDGYKDAIEKIRASQFLQGHNDKSWVVTFDWFLKNFARVLEGQFDDKSKLSSGEGEDEIAAAIRGFLER